jgi:hypothetical protein
MRLFFLAISPKPNQILRSSNYQIAIKRHLQKLWSSYKIDINTVETGYGVFEGT